MARGGYSIKEHARLASALQHFAVTDVGDNMAEKKGDKEKVSKKVNPSVELSISNPQKPYFIDMYGVAGASHQLLSTSMHAGCPWYLKSAG